MEADSKPIESVDRRRYRPTCQPRQRLAAPCMAVVIAALVGCQNVPGPAGSIFVGSAGASGSSMADTSAETSRKELMSMLTRADPKVCTATSDASYADTLRIYAKIGFGQGPTLARAASVSDAELQRALDDLRPHLRTLARNTTWLPMEAEKLIGAWLFTRSGYQSWTPPARQRPLLDNTIMPMFNELKRYAAEDVKSPLPFELRVVKDDVTKTPQAVAGGMVLIPSGMFSSLANVKDLKEKQKIVAFMLAHEFSHSLRRHKTKLAQQSLVDSMTKVKEYRQLAKVMDGGFSSLTNLDQLISFSITNVTSLMNEVCTARNWVPNLEQAQELEADVCGTLLLSRLGAVTGQRYSALEGYRAYVDAKLADDSPAAALEGGCTVKTTHPSSQDREKNLFEYSSALAAVAAR